MAKTLYRIGDRPWSPPLICSWVQVDTCLREIAESRIAIQEEEARLKRRIAILEKYAAEAIDPAKVHIEYLEKGLREFVRKSRKDMPGNERFFQFGKVKIAGTKIVIEPNLEVAAQRRDKP